VGTPASGGCGVSVLGWLARALLLASGAAALALTARRERVQRPLRAVVAAAAVKVERARCDLQQERRFYAAAAAVASAAGLAIAWVLG
jgi:hypothetical protein